MSTSAAAPTSPINSARSTSSLATREPHKFLFEFSFEKLVISVPQKDEGAEKPLQIPENVQVFWSRGKKQNGFTSVVPREPETTSLEQQQDTTDPSQAPLSTTLHSYTFNTENEQNHLNFSSTLFYDLNSLKFKKKTIQFMIHQQQPEDASPSSPQNDPIGRCSLDLGHFIDSNTSSSTPTQDSTERNCDLDFVSTFKIKMPHSESASFDAELHLHIKAEQLQESVEALKEKSREFRKYIKVYKQLKADHEKTLHQLTELQEERNDLQNKLKNNSQSTKTSTPEPHLTEEYNDLEVKRKALQEFISEQELISKMKEEELAERNQQLEEKYEMLLNLEQEFRLEEKEVLRKLRQKEQSLADLITQIRKQKQTLEEMEAQKTHIQLTIRAEEPSSPEDVQSENVEETPEEESSPPQQPPVFIPSKENLFSLNTHLSNMYDKLVNTNQTAMDLQEKLSPDVSRLEQQLAKVQQDKEALSKKKLNKKKRAKQEKSLDQKEQTILAELDPLREQLADSAEKLKMSGLNFQSCYTQFLLDVARYNDQYDDESLHFEPTFQVNFAQFMQKSTLDEIRQLREELEDKRKSVTEFLQEVQSQKEKITNLKTQLESASQSTLALSETQIQSEPYRISLSFNTDALREREEALAEKEALLEKKWKEFEERSSALKDAEEQLSKPDSTTEGTTTNEDNQSTQLRIDSSTAELEKREQALIAREQDLNRREEQIQQKENSDASAAPQDTDASGEVDHAQQEQLEQQRMALQQQEASLHDREQSLKQQLEQLHSREKELQEEMQRKEAELVEKSKELDNLEQKLHEEQKASRASSSAVSSDLPADVQELRQKLLKEQEQVDRTKSQLQEKQSSLDSRTESLSQQEKSVKQREEALTARQKKLDELERSLKKQQRELSQQASKVESRLAREVRELRSENKSLRQAQEMRAGTLPGSVPSAGAHPLSSHSGLGGLMEDELEDEIQLYQIRWNHEKRRFDRIPIESQ